MRYLIVCGVLAFGGLLAAQVPPPVPMAPLYTALPSDVAPEVRSGRVFVPVRVIAEQFGATVQWNAGARTITLQRANAPRIVLTIGQTRATVGTGSVTLDAAPYIFQGRTMVPLRFISETYGAAISYDQSTRSVRLPRGDRLYILPLEDTRSGIVIADPPPNVLVRNPVRVQGQANVYEGALIIEVQDSGGQVLGRTIATAGMGAFYPFSTQIYYNLPSEDPSRGRIVVYSQNGRGDGQILARDVVEVMLASTL